MASPNLITKIFEAFKGLDLRSSDILRDKSASTEMKNMQYRQTGAMTKRKGYQYETDSDGGHGLYTYKNVNITTGDITEEIVTVDDTLSKIVTNTFNITYTGSGSQAIYNLYIGADGNFYFDIVVDATTALSQSLGTGLEGSPYTITSLVAAINALADFTSGTISAGGSKPAAFIPQKQGQTIATGAGTSVSFKTITAIDLPGTYSTPLSTFNSQITDSNFENATFAQMNDVLYISTGHNVLHKYDGTRFYKAGLPKATTPTAAAASTGASFTAGRVLRYKVETQYTDAKSNIIYSEISEYVEETVDGSGNSINVSYTELAASSGYDTDGTMVYNIFRTDDSADATDTSLYYLIATIAQSGSSPYEDTGATEGAQYVEPIKQRGLPPSGRYIDSWRGQLIISGILDDVTKVAYSDIDSPEYFPSADNSFKVDTKVTGLRSMNNVLYVFQDRTIDGVTGDFGTDQFQVDNLSREGIGCEAHATIAEVHGQLFFLSKKGVRAIRAEGISDVGFQIQPKFDVGNSFTFKQAVGYNWESQEKYLLFMPQEPVDASYSNDTNNEIYAYDTAREAWLEWDAFNFMGGITEFNDELFIQRRVKDGGILKHIAKISANNSKYDYADHSAAISFVYKSHWETVGEPSIYKKFLRIKVHSYDTSVNDFEVDQFDLTLKTENDYNISTLTNVNMDFSGGALGWGLGPWGNFPWGESRLVQLRNKLASKKAKSMRVIFENNTILENVLISGYELDIASSYRMRLKA